MNDKLRSILHTTWNEPRHFFFWLAMLSICGFIVAAGSAAMIGPVTFLAFVALGCILCFLVCIPAFVLAWIPPVRRLFAWLLRRRFLVLVCLVTLVALFYTVEDWRGRRAWQKYKRAWEAKGERFEWASLAPPPVPKDQNFFETPLWTDLHFVETNRSTVWSDTNWQHHVIFSVYVPSGQNPANTGSWSQNPPSTGSWMKAQRVDLLAWQAFYRGSNNVPAAEQRAVQAFRKRYDLKPYGLERASTRPTTNYFPIAKEPQTPGADVLLALSQFNENRQLLIAASARPHARFWVNYDAGLALMIPHLSRIKATSQYLSLHATAALKAGDRETALEDIRLLFRLVESISSEPIMISQLVRIAMLQIALQPVWEGMADRQWTIAELGVIENELGKLDFLPDYHFAMSGERACGLWWLDYIRKAGFSGLSEVVVVGDDLGLVEQLKQFLSRAAFRLIPTGWFDQNKLTLCRMNEKYLLPLSGDQGRRIISPSAIQQANSALERQLLQGWRPYDVFSRLLVQALGRFAEKCALAQCSVDLARVACALERYRLSNGRFPDTLDSLAPKFIARLPGDVINGQPLKYRRTDDGQFVLYSVGLDETDDGGTVGLTKNGNFDWSKGDWVWRYPAK